MTQPVVLGDVLEDDPPCLMWLQYFEDLDCSRGSAATGQHHPSASARHPFCPALVQSLHPPTPAHTHLFTLRWALGPGWGVTQLIPTSGCPIPPHDSGTGDLDISEGSRPLSVVRASALLRRLESLPLGCCCRHLCWQKGFRLPPPPAALLSPALGWSVGSPSASSAETLPRRRRSQ